MIRRSLNGSSKRATQVSYPCFILVILLTTKIAFANDSDLPTVPEGFVVDVVAKEPMVSNPCVMAFDRLGRIFVGQGPQWRAPTPETAGDRVDILIDDDGDGIADHRKTFADGFNSIQGLAWKGGDLCVANSPDLTVVRDTDGDDQADEYIRVYTGLGNLEHSLHGLNFAPDGKLYMSKGNSRGYNRLDQLAPKPFRELWGLPSPEGAPDYTPIEVTDREGYQRKYHTPSDDWGQSGGILRCDPYQTRQTDGLSSGASDERRPQISGRNLEIVSRGFRNPWDITFDDAFNWLGTDNDQTQGDKIFAPFFGAHFGWGHPWSYHWTGEDHLPTVPASAPLFEGSGAGVIYYHAKHFPAEYRDLFLINDWMGRKVYAFRPKWDGALMTCEGDFPPVFAHVDGGRTLPGSSGRVFEPTDIEVGPDGALYVLSWGHAYGATIRDGKQVDAGRVYRIRHAASPLTHWNSEHRRTAIERWSLDELFADLGSHVPAWRTDAQEEFVRRGNEELQAASLSSALKTTDGFEESPAAAYLVAKLQSEDLTTAEQTWTLWTLARLRFNSYVIDTHFAGWAFEDSTDDNTRLQSLRILAFRNRMRPRGDNRTQTKEPRPGHRKVVQQLLTSDNPRLRHAMVQAIWQSHLPGPDEISARKNDTEVATSGYVSDLLNLAAAEKDRVTFYATWKALSQLAGIAQRKSWLADKRPGVRLAALLGLLDDDVIDVDEVLQLRSDSDARVAGLVELWLEKTGGAEPLVTLDPPPGEYTEPITVTLNTSVPQARLNFTTDGSTPVNTSQRYGGPIRIDRHTTLKVIIAKDNTQAGPVITGEYRIRHVEPYRHRAFITDVQAKAPGLYRMDWTGIAANKRHYTDRDYYITRVPPELQGIPFLQTCNQHGDRTTGSDWLRMKTDSEVTVLVGVDVRVNAPLEWMQIGQPNGFEDTGLEVTTTDATFRVYRKQYPPGPIVLGGSKNDPQRDSGRGMYIVMFDRPLLSTPRTAPASQSEVIAAMTTASPERGRELFLHPKGAGCVKCHRMEGLGPKYAPDLSDVGSRAKKAEILIQSILDPSAVITEGFAQQQIVTTSGKVFSGAVLEETGRSLKLVNSDGQPTTIRKSEIEERIGTKLSPMPAGFDKLLYAQQIADIVAWLMTQKSVGDRSGFSFRDKPDRIEIHFGEQRIATYLKRHPKLTRRALVNVTTPGGIQVTRNFPPRAPEDVDPGYKAEHGIIHPVMHPGLWISYGDVNGNDYWRLKAKVVFDGFVEPPAGDRTNGSFAVKTLLLREGVSEVDTTRLSPADIVCTEITRYRFERVPEGLLLRIDAEYQSDDHDFYFGDQEESGLAVRVASHLRVQGGNGTILNSRGERNGADVWGKQADWFDYFGTIDGRQVGVMIVSDPNNPRPSWLHARDYGVVVTNPFPKQPRERKEPYVKTYVRRGEPFKLSWAVLIHDLPASQPLDHDQTYKNLLRTFAR